jgi:hypothetical protein
MPAAPAADEMAHRRFVLSDLLNMTHEVARAMHRHIVAPGPEVPVLAAAATFNQAARSIRQTVMVQERLDKSEGPEGQPARQRVAARKRILRDVEDAIQRNASGARAERLYVELAERLEGPELEDEIGHRPVAEIVADLCRDLGIAHVEGTHPWKRRRPADIAALCERAARPPGAPAGAGPMPPPEGPPPPPRSGGTGPRPVDPDLGDSDRDLADWDDRELEDGELEDGELEEREARAPEPDPIGGGDPGTGGPNRTGSHLPAPDMSNYEPGARAWLSPDRVFPGRAAPDTTRPNGRASFRGG